VWVDKESGPVSRLEERKHMNPHTIAKTEIVKKSGSITLEKHTNDRGVVLNYQVRDCTRLIWPDGYLGSSLSKARDAFSAATGIPRGESVFSDLE
jgi:hypothetical protein